MTVRRARRPVGPRAVDPFAAAVLAGLVTASISGCAAGQRAQTSNEFSVVDGVSADVSTIGLRDLGVAPPVSNASYARADTAQLAMGIVNNGRTPDALVSGVRSRSRPLRWSRSTVVRAVAPSR